MIEDVNAVAAEYWEFQLRTSPSTAHMLGDYRRAAEFEDVSREAEDARIAEARSFARRAAAIPTDGLGTQDRITRDVLLFDATVTADAEASRLKEIEVDSVHGPQATLPLRISKLSVPSAEVAEAMVEKFRGIARMFVDLGERHREGIARGRTPVDFAVRGSIDQIDAWLARPVDDDPLLAAVQVPGTDHADGWHERLREAVEREVRPALAGYRDVLHGEVLAHARTDDHCGLTWIPDGDEAYARAVRLHTTLGMGPREIHEIGLQQVERLAGEYRELGSAVLGTDDLERILNGLRSDPALHHTDGTAIVAAAAAALARAAAAMGDWFGTLPKSGCDVEGTTSGAQAFYFPPAQDGSRGGVFFMNTTDPSGWGRFDIESTAYHEGIPGHHLQIAISGELEGLPAFRRHGWVTAYGEGWGLYAERLADEMGLYTTPLDRLGMLSADSMRACRLVVDTGMHALGWSREQAVAYMVENSPMRESHVRAEIDRYINDPGQALAYMIGRLEIQRIRARAERTLGGRFDIRAFHDALLTSGSMPLPLLDEHVGAWVASLDGTAHDGAGARRVPTGTV